MWPTFIEEGLMYRGGLILNMASLETVISHSHLEKGGFVDIETSMTFNCATTTTTTTTNNNNNNNNNNTTNVF